MTGGPPVDVLKVSSKSNPNACAGALAGVIRHSGAAELQVVGAGALNQAVKAVAIARGFLEPAGLDLVCVPRFADIEIDGQRRTAIRLLVEDRDRRAPGAVVAAAAGEAARVIEVISLDGPAAGVSAEAGPDGAAPGPSLLSDLRS